MSKKYLGEVAAKAILSQANAFAKKAKEDAVKAQKVYKGGTGITVAEDGTISATGEAAVDPDALPDASATQKGAVKVGDGLEVAEGVVSVSGDYAKTADVTAAISAAKDELIGGAPATYDTLKEIADYIAEDKDGAAAMTASIGGKADKATTLAGYGIADAKIAGGVITLGSQSITPLTEHQSLEGYVQEDDLVEFTAAEIEAMAAEVIAAV